MELTGAIETIHLTEQKEPQAQQPQISTAVIQQSTSRLYLMEQQILMSKQLEKDQFASGEDPNYIYFDPDTGYQPTFGPIDLSLESNRLSISNLLSHHIGKAALGKYLICRTIVWPMVMVYKRVFLVVEDPDEDKCLSLSLYNWFLDEELDKRFLPIGTTLVIRNPWLKVFGSGLLGIRVDNPAEVDIANDIYTGWGPLIKTINDGFGEENPEALTAIEYKAKGNQYFHQEKFHAGIRAYSFGISMDPKNTALLTNRSLSYLKTGRPIEALQDAEATLGLEPTNPKAIWRKAVALARIGKHQEALKFLESKEVKPIVSENSALQDLIHGNNSIGKFQVEIDSGIELGTYLNCKEYMGPVKIEKIHGKGRGMIATDHISGGENIMASRAFDSVTLINDASTRSCASHRAVKNADPSIPILRTPPKSQRLIASIALRLKERPELMAQLYQLYAGREYEPLSKDLDPQATSSLLVDMERIEKIVFFNSFGSETSKKSFSGIWIEPSFLNHSCTPNASIIVAGDFVFVLAERDIEAGTEVLISYVDPSLKFEERKKGTNRYGFICRCGRCKRRI